MGLRKIEIVGLIVGLLILAFWGVAIATGIMGVWGV